jgi:hypothetical protein
MKLLPTKVVLFFTVIFFSSFSAESVIKAQNSVEPTESHYVFPKFLKGTVKMKNGHRESKVMNYNMITEEMVYDKDGVMMAIDRLGTIDTVYFETRKFVPVEKVFYEELIKAPISLYLQHKNNLIPPGNSVGYGGTSQTASTTSLTSLTTSGTIYKLQLPSDYQVSNISQFWIRKEDKLYKASGERQVLKIFPEKAKEIKEFISQNKLNVKKTDDLITLVKKCNELSK